MDNIMKKEFEGHIIRYRFIDGKAWFALKDICNAIEIVNNRSVSARLDDDEKDVTPFRDAIGRLQDTTIINESGLLRLVQTSSKIPTKNKLRLLESLGIEGTFISSSKEADFLYDLEQALEPLHVKLSRQHTVGPYFIDAYIESLNVAIEYDENGHNNYSHAAHKGRQSEIEGLLGCEFIRVTDKDSDSFNVGVVLNRLNMIMLEQAAADWRRQRRERWGLPALPD